jgi:Zn-dependent peptidase ImmA (M78 family)/DNA-binding XRE family transcriptional regulator
MNNNFGNRLISARKMSGISLQSLSDKLGNIVTKQSLNKYEQGKMIPDSALVLKIANVLHVPANYFYTEPSVDIKFENIEFRKYKSKLSKTQEEAILEKSKDLLERTIELENVLNIGDESKAYFKYPKPVATAQDAEDAAFKLREEWNLGYDPIPDVIDMLEDKGFKIFEIEASEGFDGLKADIGSQKIIVLRKIYPGDDVVRRRFTALHELAHHLLDFAEGVSLKEEEKLCHVFASALLYPPDMAKKELFKGRFHFYLEELKIIKERWGISISAIFSRALQLNIISENVYKKLMIGYKSRGFHIENQEPGRFMSNEVPTRMKRLVYIGLAKEVLSINEAAYFLGTTSWQLQGELNKMI